VVPKLGSFIASGTWDSREVGLDTFPPRDRPPVIIPFFTFRIMVGMGLIMLAVSWFGVLLLWRGRLERARWFLWAAFASFPSGFVAVLCGWFTAEVGRQPWVVYGVMRTADAVSSHGVLELSVTLALFVVIYLLVFGAGFFYLLQIIGRGPTAPDAAEPEEGGAGQPRHPMRPISASTGGAPAD